MKKITLLSALFLSSIGGIYAQPKAEVRAVWLSNYGLDWPSSTNATSQKQEMINLLDELAAININTVIFQAQVRGDVAWDSSYQPAMFCITGNGAKSMSYDVSEFVIEECHKRNMECHAWIVPFRIGTVSQANRYKNNEHPHIYSQHPDWCCTYSNALYLNPGLPEVREYLVDVYRELVTNYDFDGINFDYTRYPTSSTSDFDDTEAYQKYNPEGLPRGDWRRENINTLVAEVYDMAKSIKPEIKVGSAPIGTYQNLPGYGNMTAYSVFQDPKQWIESGHHDLIIPQEYFNEKYGFSDNMTTWENLVNGRHLIIGTAPYKMVDGTNDWEPEVMFDQIETIRSRENTTGVCFFRAKHIVGSETKIQTLHNELQDNYFKYPAHIPPMEHNGITTPGKPSNVSQTYQNGQYVITWDEPEVTESPIRYYSVYFVNNGSVDLNDVTKQAAHIVKGNELIYTSDDPDLQFAVTAFDQGYYESEPAFAGTTGIDDIYSPASHISFSYNTLTIEGDRDLKRVEIYAINGTQVMQTAICGSTVSIDCGHMNKGVYIVRTLYVDGGVNVNKIMR